MLRKYLHISLGNSSVLIIYGMETCHGETLSFRDLNFSWNPCSFFQLVIVIIYTHPLPRYNICDIGVQVFFQLTSRVIRTAELGLNTVFSALLIARNSFFKSMSSMLLANMGFEISTYLQFFGQSELFFAGIKNLTITGTKLLLNLNYFQNKSKF